MAFRPDNLPKKSYEEEQKHRKLVDENRKQYLIQKKRKEKEILSKKKREEERELRLSLLKNKWESEILPFWNELQKEKWVEKLWREGIPSSIRGKVWVKIIGNMYQITPQLFKIYSQKGKKVRELFNEKSRIELNLVKGDLAQELKENQQKRRKELELKINELMVIDSKETSINAIQLDIPRTFPELAFFKHEGGSSGDMQEVLEAFSIMRPDIGYVQGMSYIVGMLLLYLEPVNAFIGLIQITCNWLLRPFFLGDKDKIFTIFSIFRNILYYNCPEVAEHFDLESIQPQIYLVEWFMTVFVKSFDLNIASIIWDYFFLEGELVLFKAGVAVLKIFSKDLLTLDFEGIALFFKQLKNKFKDEEQIINEINNIGYPEWIIGVIQSLKKNV